MDAIHQILTLYNFRNSPSLILVNLSSTSSLTLIRFGASRYKHSTRFPSFISSLTPKISPFASSLQACFLSAFPYTFFLLLPENCSLWLRTAEIS